jgi:hypothetical protein
MAEQTSTGTTKRRSRRQLFAGGTGALAAVPTAQAIARPAPAYAGVDVVLGGNNVAEDGHHQHHRRRHRAPG